MIFLQDPLYVFPNKLENKVESWILSVLKCGKRLEAMKLVITSVRPLGCWNRAEAEAPNKHLALLRSIIIVTVVNIIVINIINRIITSPNMAVTIPLKTELLGLFLL